MKQRKRVSRFENIIVFAFYRWCSPVGIFKPWPLVCSGMVHSRWDIIFSMFKAKVSIIEKLTLAPGQTCLCLKHKRSLMWESCLQGSATCLVYFAMIASICIAAAWFTSQLTPLFTLVSSSDTNGSRCENCLCQRQHVHQQQLMSFTPRVVISTPRSLKTHHVHVC